MISYIKGELSEILPDVIVVEANGIGYNIYVPGSVLGELPSVGSEVKIYTYMNVKEDECSLYGFLTRDDLSMFKMLICVNGIGPKAALGALSNITADDLRFAVLADDVAAIKALPGIGPKTAQKIIIDVKDIKKDDLRRSLAMVIQDTHLFTGTISDNIRYGKLDATDEEIRVAAKIANADSFITRLPRGYDTMLTADGSNLSQGQRQLLAIARAAIAKPPVLILDEATSSIDTRTERLIEKGMDAIMEGRTVFVIAHRLSTVRNSNAIMVLEKGEVIERGSHDELLEQKGRYYQLYTGQFELE